MTRLSAFFHGSETHLGVFYPEHYLLAVFSSFPEADQALRKFLHASGRQGAAIAVPGAEVILFAEEHSWKQGLWGWIMTSISRAFGTEAVYADRDLDMARRGAALLAVHCPTRTDKNNAWNCLQSTHPLAARYYAFGGLEHLAGDA
jgi:hypothetical protein